MNPVAKQRITPIQCNRSHSDLNCLSSFDEIQWKNSQFTLFFSILFVLRQTQDENLVNIADQSYRIIVRAYIFKILALELFFVPIGGEIDPDLASTFKKFREEKILSSWIACVTFSILNKQYIPRQLFYFFNRERMTNKIWWSDNRIQWITGGLYKALTTQTQRKNFLKKSKKWI